MGMLPINNMYWVIVVVLLWILPWKGYALWKAARKGETKWFVALLVINTFAILDILYIFIFSKDKKKETRETQMVSEEK
ncbi:hypothetical protein IT403_02520 [Candidatus Nomurabacteria bacterium]|nr:hypothetical protein [Candidatus Nomurabacteria bacterium]